MFPFHLDTGFSEMYFYEGMYFLIAILLGIFWAYKRVKKYGGKIDEFEGLITWSLIAALLGARLSHYMFWQPEAFFSNPLVFFTPTGAGTSITGGLVGGILAGYIYAKKHNMNFWKYFSLLSPGILLGQAVGRLGCFFNGDAYGTATNSFFGTEFPRYGTWLPSFELETGVSSPAWRYSFENGLVDQASTMSAALHPTQLYEMFGDLVLIGVVIYIFNKTWHTDKKSPLIFFVHTGGYALLRFALEFIRGDKEGIIFWDMTGLQFVLLGYGIFTIVYAARYFSKKINAY